mmetsp:Transcript_30074/g.70100  ORF Transcript_30074/g.70100 Transcript_30074/m.70100 type:complete len:587 (+) Transcript_30074:73-1833(+)
MGADLERSPNEVTEETWAKRATARQRQIDIGKARPEYQQYERAVPVEDRRPGMPQTPNPHEQISKRAFDRQLSLWRRKLHDFKPESYRACHAESQESTALHAHESPAGKSQEYSPATDSTHVGSDAPLSPSEAAGSGAENEEVQKAHHGQSLQLASLLPPAHPLYTAGRCASVPSDIGHHRLVAPPLAPPSLLGAPQIPAARLPIGPAQPFPTQQVGVPPPWHSTAMGGPPNWLEDPLQTHPAAHAADAEEEQMRFAHMKEMQQLQQRHQAELQRYQRQRQMKQAASETSLLARSPPAATLPPYALAPGDVATSSTHRKGAHPSQRPIGALSDGSAPPPPPVRPEGANCAAQTPSQPVAGGPKDVGVAWPVNSVLVPAQSPVHSPPPPLQTPGTPALASPPATTVDEVQVPHTPPKKCPASSCMAVSPTATAVGWDSLSPSARHGGHLDTPSPEQHPHRYDKPSVLSSSSKSSSLPRTPDENVAYSPPNQMVQAMQYVQVRQPTTPGPHPFMSSPPPGWSLGGSPQAVASPTMAAPPAPCSPCWGSCAPALSFPICHAVAAATAPTCASPQSFSPCYHPRTPAAGV